MKTVESNKLKIRLNNRSIYIDEKNICYCQAEGCYSRIFLESGKSYMVSKTLKTLEEQLSDDCFVRCHRSYLINMKKIISHEINRMVTLKNSYKIPVSIRNLAYLLNKRHAYLINKK